MKSRTPKLVLLLTALLFCYGFLLGGQQLVLTPICEQFGIGVGLCVLVGFTYGPIWTTIVAGAAERFPQHKASATGLMSASCGLGGIIYPMFMGIIVDSMDIRIGFTILAVSAVIGAVMAFALKNKN